MKNRVLWPSLAVFSILIAVVLRWGDAGNQHSLEKREKLLLERENMARPDKPGEAMAYWAGFQDTPNGENPQQINWEQIRAVQSAQKAGKMADVLPLSFEDLGPGNFGGRIRGMAVRPSDVNQILIGSVSGGIWKTVNGGNHWLPASDFPATLSISHILIDPDNENRVFAGSGEGYSNFAAMRGIGIIMSEDFGSSWQQLPSTNNGNFAFSNRLVRIPGSSVLLAATRTGIFRSADLGGTWSEVSGISTQQRGFVDLKIDPTDANIMLAFHYGQRGSISANNFLMRSVDGGNNWTRLGANQGLPVNGHGRMEIGWGNDGTVYVSVGDNSNAAGTLGLWRSGDRGANFAKTASPTAFIERQGWYNQVVAVNPSNSQNVVFGAIDVYVTTDGGTTISKVSNWNPAPNGGQVDRYVHADIHAIEFHPTDPNVFWVGTDGGLFRSDDGGQNYHVLNNGLRITQFYGLAVHPDGSQAVVGTQDNGSLYYFGSSRNWLEWAGGDGGYVVWDQQQPQFIFGSLPRGGLYGADISARLSAPRTLNFPGDGTQGLFIAPFTGDPNNGDVLIAGTNQVFYTGNARQLNNAVWASDSISFGAPITALAISPHNGAVAYAGTTLGAVFKTESLGSAGAWVQISRGAFAASDVTSITVDRVDTTGNTVYVTLADYGGDRVQKTVNGGDSWTSISGDLPNIPTHSLLVDPLDASRLFLGTEIGLFTTSSNGGDGAFQWHAYDRGTGFSRITQLVPGPNGELFVGTYGRGLVKGTRSQARLSNNQLEEIEGDGDRFLDRGERHRLPVVIENTSTQAISSASLTATSNNPDIELRGLTTQTVSEIAAGQSAVVPLELSLYTGAAAASTGVIGLSLQFEGKTLTHQVQLNLAANPSPEGQTGFTHGGEVDGVMTHEAILDVDDWARVTTQARSGQFSWFAANADTFADKSLMTPWLSVNQADADFSFWLFYDTEGDATQRWDGMILEMRTESLDWFDVGSRNTGIPYDGRFFDNTTLRYRLGWSGSQRSWRQGRVTMGEYNGQKVQFRFHMACDTQSIVEGVWIDDLQATGVTWDAPPVADEAVCANCTGTKGTSLANVYHFPQAVALDGGTLYIGAVNDSGSEAATVEVTGFDAAGRIRQVATASIAANGRLWRSLAALFPENHGQVRWVQLGSNLPLTVFGELQGPGYHSAYKASEGLADFAFLPHVAKNTTGFATYIASVNGAPESGNANLNSSAEGSAPVSLAPSHQPYQQLLGQARTYFGDTLQQTDWATLDSDRTNIAAMEYFSVLPNETRVAALGLTAEKGKLLRFLHIAKDTNSFWTGMVYFNPNSQAAQVSETYYNDAGEVLAQLSENLPPSGKITRLFDAATVGNPVPAGSAWMEVTSDQDIVGYELFGSPVTTSADVFAGLQGAYQSGSQIVYPHIQSNAQLWTGIVALNVGDEMGNLTMTLYGEAGNVLETVPVENIAAKSKRTFLVRSLFSQQALDQAHWMRAESSQSQWAGFLLWGDLGSPSQNMSGMNARVYP